MNISLNRMVSMLAERAGAPFDVTLQESMKIVLNYKRANFFKKTLQANPMQRRFFFKDFVVPLEHVDTIEYCGLTDCQILRSTLPVPLPIRNNDALFDFVGDPDKGDAYGYATPDQFEIYKKWNKYTGDRPKYYYSNGYLYILSTAEEFELEYVNVRGVYDDPSVLKSFKCPDMQTPCYTDNDNFEIPDDLIMDIIQDTLKVELRQYVIPATEQIAVKEEQHG